MKQLYKKTVGMPKVTVDMPKRNIITDWTNMDSKTCILRRFCPSKMAQE
jgi:hypothetical protein